MKHEALNKKKKNKQKMTNRELDSFEIKDIQEIFQQINIGMVIIKADLKIEVLNNYMLKIIGDSLDNLINKTVDEVKFFDELYNVILLKTEGHFFFKYKGKHIGCSIKNFYENDKFKQRCLLFHDFDDAKIFNENSKTSNYLMKESNAFFEASDDAILFVDKEGTILNVNKAYTWLMEVSKESCIGKKLVELLGEENAKEASTIQAIRNKKISNAIVKKEEKSFVATATPTFDEHGELDFIITVIRDITQMQQLQEELIKEQTITKKISEELMEKYDNDLFFSNVVRQSQQMNDVMEMIKMASKFDSGILVTGESGVGKEVICKEIHYLSTRKDKPFVKVNCGAIPSGLFESEMFGYEEGAFTGAKEKGKKGYFEQADGGTLFLDEVGEISLDMQVKLLRVLQDKKVQRVGAEKTIDINVRIIAATNKELNKAIEENLFREDLFYRLNVINIHIPPLRERREDIIALMNMFVRKFNIKYDKKRYLTNEIYSIFTAYGWPGNVRELENVVEYLMVITTEDKIDVELLPDKIRNYKDSKKNIIVNGVMNLREAQEIMERNLFENAIKNCRSPKEMAEILGINQSTVSRKLKAYNLK